MITVNKIYDWVELFKDSGYVPILIMRYFSVLWTSHEEMLVDWETRGKVLIIERKFKMRCRNLMVTDSS